MGPCKSFLTLPVSNQQPRWDLALRAWKTCLLKVSDVTSYFFGGQPQFSLFYHSEVPLNSSLIGGQKQVKIRGGSSVLNQEGPKGKKTGSAATRERRMKELTSLHLPAS